MDQAQGTPIELQATASPTTTTEDHHVEAQHEQSPTNVASAAPSALDLAGTRRLKLASAAFCFFNCGINDGSLGALLPYILRDYTISTSWISIVYACTFLGWLLAAFIGGYSRMALGVGGVIIAGAALQFLAQMLRFWVPPFGLFAVTFFLVTLGQGLQEPQANTFVAGLKSAHRWLGLIHGSYAVGALVGPLVAAAIASTTPSRWAYFYFVPMGIGAINVTLCSYAFREDTSLYQRRNAQQSQSDQRRSTTALVEFKATLKQRPVWLLSMFFFLYLGVAITAGGWVVEYLATVRRGRLSRVGYISSAFYGGLAAGRLLLIEPTFRFGEKRMFLGYAVVSLALQIVFWRVDNIVVDAVMVTIMGFLLGPAFATGVSVGSKLIPAELQPSGLAMIFLIGQVGGAIFPAVTGVVASTAGVGTLQPILVGTLALMVVSWGLVPDPRKMGSQASG